MQIDEL